MEEKKFHYVYLTTNLINEHQYVGDRSCNCEPEKDKYLGSGIYYKDAEKLYGKQNFQKQILEIFETRKEAFDAQEKYIIQYNTLVPNGYNISPRGGHMVKNSVSVETLEKIKNTKKNREYKKRIPWNKGLTKETDNRIYDASIKQKNKYVSDKTRKKQSESKRGLTSTFKGKHHSKESKNKLSISHKGKKQSKETLEKKSKKLKGLKRSEETKQKMKKPKSEEHRKNMSKSKLGIIFSEEHCKNISKSHLGQIPWNKGKKKNR
jgi:hypothetical protein